jgi:hypothetical protein
MAKQAIPLRLNVTLSLSTKAKLKLSRLKLRLREAGLAPSIASESAIVDRLVSDANFDDVLACLVSPVDRVLYLNVWLRGADRAEVSVIDARQGRLQRPQSPFAGKGFWNIAPAGFEPLLGGSGQSRPLPIRVILQGFSADCFPASPARYRPFPTAPLENVRKSARWGGLIRELAVYVESPSRCTSGIGLSLSVAWSALDAPRSPVLESVELLDLGGHDFLVKPRCRVATWNGADFLAISSAFGLDWHGYVFRLHDLPFAVAADPCIRPNEASLASALARPCLTPLNYRRIAEEAHMRIVQMIGKKIAWASLGVSDGTCFVPDCAIQDPHKIARQNPL